MLHKEIKENRKQRSLSQNYTDFTSFFRNVDTFLKDGPTLPPQMHKFFLSGTFSRHKMCVSISSTQLESGLGKGQADREYHQQPPCRGQGEKQRRLSASSSHRAKTKSLTSCILSKHHQPFHGCLSKSRNAEEEGGFGQLP